MKYENVHTLIIWFRSVVYFIDTILKIREMIIDARPQTPVREYFLATTFIEAEKIAKEKVLELGGNYLVIKQGEWYYITDAENADIFNKSDIVAGFV